MGLKNRVERLARIGLGRKAPGRRGPLVFSWVDPDTGECWYRLKLEPEGKGFSVIEELDPESSQSAAGSRQ